MVLFLMLFFWMKSIPFTLVMSRTFKSIYYLHDTEYEAYQANNWNTFDLASNLLVGCEKYEKTSQTHFCFCIDILLTKTIFCFKDSNFIIDIHNNRKYDKYSDNNH